MALIYSHAQKNMQGKTPTYQHQDTTLLSIPLKYNNPCRTQEGEIRAAKHPD